MKNMLEKYNLVFILYPLTLLALLGCSNGSVILYRVGGKAPLPQTVQAKPQVTQPIQVINTAPAASIERPLPIVQPADRPSIPITPHPETLQPISEPTSAMLSPSPSRSSGGGSASSSFLASSPANHFIPQSIPTKATLKVNDVIDESTGESVMVPIDIFSQGLQADMEGRLLRLRLKGEFVTQDPIHVVQSQGIEWNVTKQTPQELVIERESRYVADFYLVGTHSFVMNAGNLQETFQIKMGTPLRTASLSPTITHVQLKLGQLIITATHACLNAGFQQLKLNGTTVLTIDSIRLDDTGTFTLTLPFNIFPKEAIFLELYTPFGNTLWRGSPE